MRSTKNSSRRPTVAVWVTGLRVVRESAALQRSGTTTPVPNIHLRRRRTVDPATRRALPRNSLSARARRPARATLSRDRYTDTFSAVRRENQPTCDFFNKRSSRDNFVRAFAACKSSGRCKTRSFSTLTVRRPYTGRIVQKYDAYSYSLGRNAERVRRFSTQVPR